MKYVCGLYAVGLILRYINPSFYYEYLSLNVGAILHGQIWRLVTFLVQGPEDNIIFFLLVVYLYYMIGESLERAWGTFRFNVYYFSGVILTIIGGFIDGILDGTISEDERDKYLATVSDEVKRLSRLVVAMLNMSKIQAGKLTLNYSEIDLNDIILKIFLSFENELAAKEIDVAGLDTCEKITIKADDALINQIFYNLIDNAVKFTYEKGVISVAMKTEKNTAVIKIKNTGKGIPEEDIGLIFDRFYKGDKSRGLDSKSFGLGLYIVKSVVELHKGSINVNSKVDEYTEFVIKLPRQV